MKKNLDIKLENINVLFIDDEFVECIAKIIEEELIEMCWGTTSKDMYDYRGTVENFLNRIHGRDNDFKVGFIGEFLVHCYFRLFTDFTNLSVFFNLEDRGNKKGFDYMFFDPKSGVWYVETKSGTCPNDEIDKFNIKKLNEANNDCIEKFINKTNFNLWDKAKNEAAHVLLSGDPLRKK